MARSQVGVKFDTDELAAWDKFAEAHGMSRTTFLETAARRVVAGDIPIAPSTKRIRKPGFKGSKQPGHKDVPELGWYRPSSAEARKDVVLDPEALRLGLIAAGIVDR